jgi:hypothetical protein
VNEQQQKKGSLRWLRIILTVLGVIVLIPIVLLGFLIFWAYHGPHAPTVGDAFNASGQYYNAIQHHDYTTASNYLRGNATITVHGRPMVMNSVDTLSTTSKALDTRDGVITSYTPTDGNFEQGKDIVDMVMKVTRNDQPYDVHIKIELEGNDWKILSADGI